MHRDSKKHRESIRLPMPWQHTQEGVADVTPEERAALRAELTRRSAFRDT